MKFPGRIYHGQNTDFLAVYCFYPELHVATPNSLKNRSKRVAHATYRNGGKHRGIDIFILDNTEEIPEMRLSNPIIPIQEDLTHLDEKQDIQYDFIKDYPKELKHLIRTDIHLFRNLKNKPVKPAKKAKGTYIKHQDKIVPRTTIKEINPKQILTPGKQAFVPSCILEANIDFSKGCIAGWVPQENASFDGKTFTNYFLAPQMECEYCYALDKHKQFPLTLYKIDKKQLIPELLGNCKLEFGKDTLYKKPVKILRFGKRTEVGSKFTLDKLATILEACIETKTRTVMPNKFLAYNDEIAKLLKRTNSTLLASIGFDELEPGALAHGCTNEWRLEQAIKFKEAGVNSMFYLLMIAHAPITDRDKRVLSLARKYDINTQILPMRFGSKALAEKVTGIDWPWLKRIRKTESLAFTQDYHGHYELDSRTIVPLIINQEWLDLLKNSNGKVRMCHHNSQTTWCGGCGYLKNQITTETKHVKTNPLRKEKRKKDPKDFPGQQMLSFPKKKKKTKKKTKKK